MKSKIGIILASLYFLIAVLVALYGYNCGGGWCNFSADIPVLPEVLILGKLGTIFGADSMYSFSYILLYILAILFNGALLYFVGLLISKAISSGKSTK